MRSAGIHSNKAKIEKQDANDQLDRGHLQCPLADLIAVPHRQVGQLIQEPRTEHRKHDGRQAKAQQNTAVGESTNQCQLEQTIEEMHHCSQPDRLFNRHEQRKRRQQQRAQTKSGEKGQR